MQVSSEVTSHKHATPVVTQIDSYDPNCHLCQAA